METNKTEVLNTAKEYITSLKNGIAQAVNYYQSGEESKGSNLLIQICDGIEWLIQALVLCNDKVNVQDNINSFNEKLSAIVDAFENEDYVLIGDLLEYEVLPELEEIQNSIEL